MLHRMSQGLTCFCFSASWRRGESGRCDKYFGLWPRGDVSRHQTPSECMDSICVSTRPFVQCTSRVSGEENLIADTSDRVPCMSPNFPPVGWWDYLLAFAKPDPFWNVTSPPDKNLRHLPPPPRKWVPKSSLEVLWTTLGPGWNFTVL